MYVATAVGIVVVRAPVVQLPMGVGPPFPSNATLWLKPSRLVKVTVAPGATTIAGGANALPCRSTDVVATGVGVLGVPGVFGVLGADGVPSEEPPQPTANAKRADNTIRMVWGVKEKLARRPHTRSRARLGGPQRAAHEVCRAEGWNANSEARNMMRVDVSKKTDTFTP